MEISESIEVWLIYCQYMIAFLTALYFLNAYTKSLNHIALGNGSKITGLFLVILVANSIGVAVDNIYAIWSGDTSLLLWGGITVIFGVTLVPTMLWGDQELDIEPWEKKSERWRK